MDLLITITIGWSKINSKCMCEIAFQSYLELYVYHKKTFTDLRNNLMLCVWFSIIKPSHYEKRSVPSCGPQAGIYCIVNPNVQIILINVYNNKSNKRNKVDWLTHSVPKAEIVPTCYIVSVDDDGETLCH